MAYLLGRSYWTWTPSGLYQRLLTEPDVESIDLPHYLKTLLHDEAGRHSRSALKTIPARRDERLDEVLVELGTAVVMAAVSPSAIGLHKVAITECARFEGAVAGYWASGHERAVDRIRKILLEARRRGEINPDDCGITARRFLALLGDTFQMEIAFGLRRAPCPREVRDHVKYVVGMFLYGLGPATASQERATYGRPNTQDRQATSVAHGLIREIGESLRETVRGDDWETVSCWAEVLWSDYETCTGLTWEQASDRIRQAWDSHSAQAAYTQLEVTPLGVT